MELKSQAVKCKSRASHAWAQVFFSLMAPESSWQAWYQLQPWHRFRSPGRCVEKPQTGARMRDLLKPGLTDWGTRDKKEVQLSPDQKK
jgi:hypothetical protein